MTRGSNPSGSKGSSRFNVFQWLRFSDREVNHET